MVHPYEKTYQMFRDHPETVVPEVVGAGAVAAHVFGVSLGAGIEIACTLAALMKRKGYSVNPRRSTDPIVDRVYARAHDSVLLGRQLK